MLKTWPFFFVAKITALIIERMVIHMLNKLKKIADIALAGATPLVVLAWVYKLMGVYYTWEDNH